MKRKIKRGPKNTGRVNKLSLGVQRARGNTRTTQCEQSKLSGRNVRSSVHEIDVLTKYSLIGGIMNVHLPLSLSLPPTPPPPPPSLGEIGTFLARACFSTIILFSVSDSTCFRVQS